MLPPQSVIPMAVWKAGMPLGVTASGSSRDPPNGTPLTSPVWIRGPPSAAFGMSRNGILSLDRK